MYMYVYNLFFICITYTSFHSKTFDDYFVFVFPAGFLGGSTYHTLFFNVFEKKLFLLKNLQSAQLTTFSTEREKERSREKLKIIIFV